MKRLRLTLVAATAALSAAVLPGTATGAELATSATQVPLLNVSPPFDDYDQCDRVRAANDLDPHIDAPGPCFQQPPVFGSYYYYWSYV